jgi:hypothetical protein
MALPLPFPEPHDDDFTWDLTFDDDDELTCELLAADDISLDDHLALDDLFDAGFTWEEGVRLLILREHLYEVPEVRERVTGDPHVHFVRWLYHQGIYTS